MLLLQREIRAISAAESRFLFSMGAVARLVKDVVLLDFDENCGIMVNESDRILREKATDSIQMTMVQFRWDDFCAEVEQCRCVDVSRECFGHRIYPECSDEVCFDQISP